MKTTLVKIEDADRKWHVVDATDLPAGRLAVVIANILRGKDKPTFAPHMDSGDFVIVVNAEKIKLSGAKDDQKIYQDYTGYPSGLKESKASAVREKHPERIITQAVKGMLPRNRLSRHIITRLKVYAGPDHPHEAQKPDVLELTF